MPDITPEFIADPANEAALRARAKNTANQNAVPTTKLPVKAEAIAGATAETGLAERVTAGTAITDPERPDGEFFTTAPALVAAATADQVIGTAPIDGTVKRITYVPEALITGADANSRTLTVINKGPSGVGNTVIGTLALTAGVNAPAFDEKQFTLAAAAARKVQAGDVLAVLSTSVGTGLADPGGLVKVIVDRDA